MVNVVEHANTKVTSHVGEYRKDLQWLDHSFKSKCNGGQHWVDHSLGQTGQWSPERPLVTDICPLQHDLPLAGQP